MHTLNEIFSQPWTWQRALEEAKSALDSWRALLKPEQPIVFTGCGSTWYLAEIAAGLFRRLTGRLTVAVPGGELLLYPQDWLSQTFTSNDPLPTLIAISRSGATTETVRAAETWKARGGTVLVVTNYPDSPLVSPADGGLFLSDGQEESVIQTRSFTSMLVGLNALAALLGEHTELWNSMQRLPQVGEHLIQSYHPFAQSLGSNLLFERFYFLGSGLRYSLAREASLKMKESSLSHSEPFPFLEFRHGPMSMVNSHTMLFGMLSQENRRYEQDVLQEMQALGGHTVSLGEGEADIRFAAGLSDLINLVLYLPVLQMIAVYRSLAKGLNPDQPTHLSAVVRMQI
ncbi:MAG: SIS domain-containing protein [Anaerolineales bacterium]|nr:SIS domain-containing protein [Anaerolineales bacterium]MCX7608790.1 SIS domain-containing protein [Anaerolineales bacterium]MDW8226569.1 SIS domain-containing protein [Anaerolineales bacterium]